MSITFQVAGDYHFFLHSPEKTDFSDLITPSERFLLTTGDIIQPYNENAYNFYSYCAKNWEKTYVMMGNQEYENSHQVFQSTMIEQYRLMKNLVDHINTEMGEVKLVFIQNTYVDLPEYSLRIIGLTLWAPKSNRQYLKGPTLGFSKFTTALKEGDMYRLTYPGTSSKAGGGAVLRQVIKSWMPLDYKDNYTEVYESITVEDIKILQENDSSFLTKMIQESQEKNYKLLVCSHYIPTPDIKKESPIITSENEFPLDFFCRDIRTTVQSPIVAWVCGHVHFEQTAYIGSIPIYINTPKITIDYV
jgi:hypothetical protein